VNRSLQGKVVFVTGGARRVGRAFALAFAAAGAHIALHHSNSAADAEATAAEIRAKGVDALIVQGDFADYDAITRVVGAIDAHFGRIDVLINSASVFLSGELLDIPPEEWDQALNLNLRAPFWTTQAVGRLMRDRQIAGCILNISDTSGIRGVATRPQHSVSKAGLIMLTEVTAKALAPYQIRANCLVLGPVLPEPGRDAASIAKTADRLPLGRWGDPQDAAQAAILLASNDFITGAMLQVDGGEGLV